MTPLPEKPTVALRLDQQGRVFAVASNISPDLEIVITRDANVFKDEAANKPFDTLRPPQFVQVLAQGAH
jgi:hypothetical protein